LNKLLNMAFISSIYESIFGSTEEEQEVHGQVAAPERFEIDPDSILGEAKGHLCKYDARNETWATLDMGTVTVIIATGQTDYTTQFIVLRQNGAAVVIKNLDDNLQLRFDAASNSMNWLVYQGQQVEILQFVFQDTNLEQDIKKLIAIKLIEQNSQMSFAKVAKAVEAEEEWVMQSHEQGKIDSDYMETEEWGDVHEAVCDEEEEEDAKGFARAAKSSQVKVPDEFNRQIDDSMCYNRAYVVRNHETGADLGLFRHGDSLDLEYIGKVKIQDSDAKDFKPTKMQTHSRDGKILFLTEEDPESIAVMDMKRGEVVESWAPGKGVLKDFAPLTKYEQRTDNDLIKVCTKNSYATIDPRTKEKLVEQFQMKTNPNFTAICTTGAGQWAIGDKEGSIRLYNKTMRAKTKLPGLGSEITHIEVTEDGEWVLATTRTYLILVPTQMPDSFKLGFEVRMGKHKPKPFRLRLRPSDMSLFGISEVNFTPAKFNVGEGQAGLEKWIVTSTGRHIVKWNFDRVKKGYLQDYLICERSGKITSGNFRWNKADEMLIAETDSVYCQSTKPRASEV